jgi:hypothetical protein
MMKGEAIDGVKPTRPKRDVPAGPALARVAEDQAKAANDP